MFRASPKGNFQIVNRSLARMLGYESPEEFESAIRNVIQDAWADPADRIRFSRLISEQNSVREFECQLKRKDGTILSASLNCRRVEAESDQSGFYEGFIEDITDRKRSEEALRESLDSLTESQRAGGLGSYTLDVPSGVWSCSDVLDEIFGIGKDFERTVTGWVELIHPDERAAMAAYFTNEVAGKKKPFNREYRIVRHADGVERWVHGLGRLDFDAEGQPAKMRGVIKDITERKRSEIQLRDSEERFRQTFEQAAVGIVHSTFDGRLLRCNARFAEIIGYTLDEVSNPTYQQITAQEDSAESDALVRQIESGKTGERPLGEALYPQGWQTDLGGSPHRGSATRRDEPFI